MNTQAIARFREKLKAKEPLFGLTITLEAPAVSDIASAMGLDWIELDVDRFSLCEVREHARAALRSRTVVLFRTALGRADTIERWTDCGADGILLTNVVGESSFDPNPLLNILGRYSDEPSMKPLMIPVLNNRSMPFLQTWLSSAATDAVLLEADWAGDDRDQLTAQARVAGKPLGIQTQEEAQLAERIRQGFRLLNLGTDRAILWAEMTKARPAGRLREDEQLGALGTV